MPHHTRLRGALDEPHAAGRDGHAVPRGVVDGHHDRPTNRAPRTAPSDPSSTKNCGRPAARPPFVMLLSPKSSAAPPAATRSSSASSVRPRHDADHLNAHRCRAAAFPNGLDNVVLIRTVPPATRRSHHPARRCPGRTCGSQSALARRPARPARPLRRCPVWRRRRRRRSRSRSIFSQLCLLSLLAAFAPFGFALLFVLRHAASPCAASNYCFARAEPTKPLTPPRWRQRSDVVAMRDEPKQLAQCCGR